MSFQLKKINNEVVKPIPLPSIDPKLVKGNKLFAEIYANVFIVAKKKSGKTCTVFKIIKECCNKDTKVVIFASTLNKDLSFKVIRKYLENKGILYEEFTEVSAYLPAILEEIENDVDDYTVERFVLETKIYRIFGNVLKKLNYEKERNKVK